MDLAKIYKIAAKIAGDRGADLVHHVAAHNDHLGIDAYFVKCMQNEYINPRSAFNKLEGPKTNSLEKLKNLTASPEGLNYTDVTRALEKATKSDPDGVDLFLTCTVYGSVKSAAALTGLRRSEIVRRRDQTQKDILNYYHGANN
jgi:hypothetical protein